MNRNEKSLIIRLDEKVKSMHEDVLEIKSMLTSMNGRVRNNSTHIAKIEAEFDAHKWQHKRDLSLVGIFAGLIAAIVNLILKLFGRV
ncbi:MAG: hypothetical protein DRP11_00115 [Candidatus Aenigmatarchaeota archaeon]|nr:MAG: hypothetical protein DRP11_00115 [Candidatus Aenigmarchaeota archaeon]